MHIHPTPRDRKLYEGAGTQRPELDAALDRLLARATPGVGMTFDEMAKELPCTRQNLRMYEQRALRKIRRYFGRMLRELTP